MFVGFGSIGQGVLPLVLRHIGIKPERITIVTADGAGGARPPSTASSSSSTRLRDNFRQFFDPLLGKGDFLLNLSTTCRASR